MDWVRLRYHRWPPVLAQILDIFRAGGLLAWQNIRGRVSLFHARSYPAALMALIGRIPRKKPFLFDMRGFWPEERVSAGLWPGGGTLYRLAKHCEKMFFAYSDHIVVLTRQAKKVLVSRGVPAARISVIPTCVNLKKFHPLSGKKIRSRNPVFCFSGNCQTWYLRDAMMQAARRLMEVFPEARLMILTGEDHAVIRRDLVAHGIHMSRTKLMRLSFEKMPGPLQEADLGIFFIRNDPAAPGRAAIKLGEFLACGIPVLINAGVGDSDRIVSATGTGIILQKANLDYLEKKIPALRQMLADPLTSRRCRGAAKTHFDLRSGIRSYRKLYQALLTVPRS